MTTAREAVEKCAAECDKREVMFYGLAREDTPTSAIHNHRRIEARSCAAACRALLPPDALAEARPEVVCLCGSTRFMDAYAFHYGRLTDEGKIVLTVGRVVPQSEQALGSPRKAMLDELHKRKIDLADRVFVLNVGGYVGASTRSEIEYAHAHGKPVDYLEALTLPGSRASTNGGNDVPR